MPQGFPGPGQERRTCARPRRPRWAPWDWTPSRHCRHWWAALKDRSPGVQKAAAESIDRLGDDATRALAAMINMLKDTKADVLAHSSAASFVGRFADADVAVPALVEVLKAEPPAQRGCGASCSKCSAPGQAAESAIFQQMIRALEDKDTEVRIAAATALAHVGPAAAAALPAVGDRATTSTSAAGPGSDGRTRTAASGHRGGNQLFEERKSPRCPRGRDAGTRRAGPGRAPGRDQFVGGHRAQQSARDSRGVWEASRIHKYQIQAVSALPVRNPVISPHFI